MLNNRRVPGLARFLAIVVACLSFFPATLRAEGPPVIEVTATGPAEAYPIGQVFHVQGKVTEVLEQVDLVFVRNSHKVFGLWDPWTKPCPDIERALAKTGKQKEMLTTAPLGATELGKIWEVTDQYSSLASFRVSPWKRGPQAETTYKLTVPKDNFFRAGATYCAFLLHKEVVLLSTAKLKDALNTFAASWVGCDAKDCYVEAAQIFDSAIAETLTGTGLSTSDEEKLRNSVRSTKDALVAVREAYASLEQIALAWDQIYKNGPRGAPPALTYYDVQDTDLGRLAASLLSVHHALLPAASPPKGLTYSTPDGKTKVTHLAFDADYTKINVTPDPSQAGVAQPLQIAPRALTFPAHSYSLLDLLELSRKRMKFGGQYLPFLEGYKTHLLKVLKPKAWDMDPAKVEEVLSAFRKNLEDQRATFLAAFATDPALKQAGSAPAGMGHDVLYDALRSWLNNVLVSCERMPDALNGGAQKPYCEKYDAIRDGEPAPAWPGYTMRKETQDPIHVLLDTLNNLQRRMQRAHEGRAKLDAVPLPPTSRLHSTVSSASELEAGSWFGQYVVPTVGFAYVPAAKDSLWVNSYGFKIYPWANRIDEIKSLGSGAHRLLSLELAFVPNLRTFGPSDRFQGLAKGAVPPLMLGLSFQPIPFLTLSGGGILMERRESVLPQELPSTFFNGYVSLGIDVHLLDAIAGALNAGRGTEIQNFLTR